MLTSQIFCEFALIGEELELKKNVTIEMDNEGIISDIFYDDLGKTLEIIEGKENFLMIPGLINSHVHIGDNFAKELGYNKDLIEVVAPPNGLKHKLLKSTPIDVKIKGIQKAAEEMISNGITTFIDFRENGIDGIELIKQALKHSPIEFLTLGRFKDEIEMKQVYKIADGIGLVTYKHVSEKSKSNLSNQKEKNPKIIACHCAEKVRNKMIIQEIFDNNIIDVIMHGTQLIKKDLEQLISKKISLILCPRCNGYFGVGFPPIKEIMDLNIPISIGTDNLMANSPDLFEELRYLYRIDRENIKLGARELLKMITINAAYNFNLENSIGSLSKGKKANFLLINLNDPNYFMYNMESNGIYPLIVQRTKSENMKKVYIRGKLVFERK